MANWGPGIYENDDAMDWIYDLLDSGGLSRVKQALDVVIQEDVDGLELADCHIALAAADLVASLDGEINPNLPTEAEDWITLTNRPVSGLRAKAELVVKKIVNESFIPDQFDDVDQRSQWHGEMKSLLERLEI